MSIRHHLDDSTLMSFVAGSLPEPLSAVAAVHISMCDQCARERKNLEKIGAVLLDMVPGSRCGHAKVRSRPARNGHRSSYDGTSAAHLGKTVRVPAAVHELLSNRDLEAVAWKKLGFGVWHLPLDCSADATGYLRLLKVAPGRVMPEHGHGGSELTLLLEGAYLDETGEYRTGDVADLGDDIEHKPIADPVEGCVCLVASDSKAHFKGLIGKMVQPFTGM